MLATSFALLVPGQGACAGADQQAAPRPSRRLEQRSRRCPQPGQYRLARLEEPLTWQVVDPGIAVGVRSCFRRRSSSSTATMSRSSRPSPSRTSASSSNKGVSSSPRPAAAAQSSTQGFKRSDDRDFSRSGIPAPAAFGRPSGLAGQAPAFARIHPPLGYRARLPHGRHLLTRGPLVLLEPGRDTARPTRRDQGDQDRPERDRLRHRPRDARRQADGARDARFQGRTPPSEARCGSPSSSTPATGTSPPRPSPT